MLAFELSCSNLTVSRSPSIIGLTSLYGIIVVDKPDVSQSPAAEATESTHAPDELSVALRTLVLGVSCQHALDRHTDALDTLHWRPARRAEQVEADYAVRVDVWVDRYGTCGGG